VGREGRNKRREGKGRGEERGMRKGDTEENSEK
jgi:hypothetical protein